MAEESTSGRSGKLSVAVAVVGSIVASGAFVLGSGFFYNHWYNVPDVTFTVLPTYALESLSFGGVVVENRGRATAHDVLISLPDLGTTIQEYSVDSVERWSLESGGEQEDNLVLWMDRMTSGSSVTVYLLTSTPSDFDSVAVTTEEGPGRKAMADSESSPLARQARDSLTLASLLLIVFLVVTLAPLLVRRMS
jgi:hypothetical protein